MRAAVALIVIVLLTGCGETPTPSSPPRVGATEATDHTPVVDEQAAPRRRVTPPPDAALTTWRSVAQHVPGEPDPYQFPQEMLDLVGADAVDAIARALASPELDGRQRSGLLSILRQLGPHALPALDAVLSIVGDTDADPDLRSEAVDVIGAMGPGAERAIPALQVAMTQFGGGGRFGAAFAALGEAGWAELNRLAFETAERGVQNTGLHGLALLDPSTALRFATVALNSGDAFVRLRALSAVREYEEGSATATGAVVALLDDEDEDVREGALATLDDMHEGAAAAVPILLERMRAMPEDHDDYSEWLGSLASAGRQDDSAIRFLAEMATANGDWGERAANSLKEVQADIRPVLSEIGTALDGHTSVRIPVLDMLYRIGPDATPLLPKILPDLARDRHDSVRQSAARALIGMGPAAEAALPALRDLGPDASLNLQVLAAIAIHAIAGDVEPARAVFDALAAKRGDFLYSWRYEFPGMMGAGGAVFLPELREMLVGDDNDSRGYVMLSVAQSFERIGPPAADAVPDLMAALHEERNERWFDDIARALEAIGINDEQALTVWTPLLRHSSEETRRLAAEALARRGAAAVSALRDVRRLERDPDWRVRRAARATIAAIDG